MHIVPPHTLRQRMNFHRAWRLVSLAALYGLMAGCGGGNDPSSGPVTGNAPPTISGTPLSNATVGNPWSFRPIASDPDGQALHFEVENLPPWTQFDPVTGLLAGTPQDGDVRTWTDIRISVTDGTAVASLPSFSIQVFAAGAASGSATLTWTTPTTLEDGSPIGTVTGYRLMWGQRSGEYGHSMHLENPSITRYVIDGLDSGTWYFAVTVLTSDGLESLPSNEASKTI